MSRRSSFDYSFLVLPPAKRQAITALFDFCRVVDDSVDLETDPARAAAALELWRAEVERLFSGQEPHTPEGRKASRRSASSFALTRAHLEALDRRRGDGRRAPAVRHVRGTRTVLSPRRLGRRPALHRDLRILESRRRRLRARSWRRAPAHEHSPRCGGGLPSRPRLSAGRGSAALRLHRGGHRPRSGRGERGSRNGRVRSVLEHHAARARVFFSRATRALPAEDAANFVAAEIMRNVYADLLRRIEAAHCDVFTRLIRVPRPVQARIAIATLVRTRARARS